METYPIWKTTFWETEERRVEYRIMHGGEEIHRATAVLAPDEDTLLINLNKPCQNYIDCSIAGALPPTSAATVIPTPGYGEFSLQVLNESTGSWVETFSFAFVNDWSYFDRPSEGAMNAPINGHAAPGQYIPYTHVVTGETSEIICYTEEYVGPPYFIFSDADYTEVSYGTTAYTISWSTSYEEIKYEFNGATAITSESGITVTFPENTGDTDTTYTFYAYTTEGELVGTFHLVHKFHDYSLEYLTVEFIGNSGRMSVRRACDETEHLYYSSDEGVTWNEIGTRSGDDVSLNLGKRTLFKGDRGNFKVLAVQGSHNVYGNIMSLEYGDNFVGKTTLQPGNHNHGYYMNMYSGITSINDASNLVLPLENLPELCYEGMFSGCTNLVYGPKKLPAMNINSSCYHQMFAGCENLRKSMDILPAMVLYRGCYAGMFMKCIRLQSAPALPATALTLECYEAMFAECRWLTTAPDLPAPTLAERSYRQMFDYSGVNYIKCLATDISAPAATYLWFNTPPKSGTFVKAASMNSWPTGESGIPSGWTVENA